MNFVDLIIFVCAIASPGSCREEHLLFQMNGSLNACMMQAQPYLAQWVGEHPAYQVQRWRCEWPNAEGKDI